MKTEYRQWIDDYVRAHDGYVRGKCAKATTLMVEAFPELRRVPGFAYCQWGRDQHWWCVTPDGDIVDPTVAQFQGVVPDYEELDLSSAGDVARIPIGKCANCGGHIYRTSECTDTVCSDRCHREYVAYLMS